MAAAAVAALRGVAGAAGALPGAGAARRGPSSVNTSGRLVAVCIALLGWPANSALPAHALCRLRQEVSLDSSSSRVQCHERRAGAAAGLAALLGARGLVPGLGGEAGQLPWLLADPACGAFAKESLQVSSAHDFGLQLWDITEARPAHITYRHPCQVVPVKRQICYLWRACAVICSGKLPGDQQAPRYRRWRSQRIYSPACLRHAVA